MLLGQDPEFERVNRCPWCERGETPILPNVPRSFHLSFQSVAKNAGSVIVMICLARFEFDTRDFGGHIGSDNLTVGVGQ